MKFAYLIALALLTLRPVMAEDFYFPKGAVSEVEQKWYGKHLLAMKEPVLSPSPTDKSYFAFRILCLPTWGRPEAWRVERKGGIIAYRTVKLSGDGGYDPGTIKEEHQAELTKSAFATFLEKLKQSGFWELPEKNDVNGRDGSLVIIEAIQDGRHVVLVRWTPSYDTDKRGLSGLTTFTAWLYREHGLSEPK